MSTGEWANNCITGSDQVSVIIQITDSCPECEANHFDLQALTYNKVRTSQSTGANKAIALLSAQASLTMSMPAAACQLSKLCLGYEFQTYFCVLDVS